MRVLLDTHVLIWALGSPDRLAPAARLTIEDGVNEVFFSAASIWEVAIKRGLGRSDCQIDPARLAEAARATGFAEAPVRAGEAAYVAELARHHRDPFDRLLIAQARGLGAFFYTRDAVLTAYSDLVRLV